MLAKLAIIPILILVSPMPDKSPKTNANNGVITNHIVRFPTSPPRTNKIQELIKQTITISRSVFMVNSCLLEIAHSERNNMEINANAFFIGHLFPSIQEFSNTFYLFEYRFFIKSMQGELSTGHQEEYATISQ